MKFLVKPNLQTNTRFTASDSENNDAQQQRAIVNTSDAHTSLDFRPGHLARQRKSNGKLTTLQLQPNNIPHAMTSSTLGEKVGNHQLYEVRTGHVGPARMRTDNCRSESQASERYHQNDALWLS